MILKMCLFKGFIINQKRFFKKKKSLAPSMSSIFINGPVHKINFTGVIISLNKYIFRYTIIQNLHNFQYNKYFLTLAYYVCYFIFII